MGLSVRRLTGPAIRQSLDALAELRITVFRAWPYLYAGSHDYERAYLAQFAASPRAVIVGAFAGSRLVGAATAMPLADEHEAFRAPFEAHGEDVNGIFYFAESVLLAAYRGQGIGHAFFDHREEQARALGFARAVFCAVERPVDHPLRPADYRALDPFWRRRGYRPLQGISCRLSWPDLGAATETEKTLHFWSRSPLDPACRTSRRGT